ncbi:MAG: PIN domain-containing protein [Chloroflexota bacterium]|nr:PIN domain-containing protein [Chloroflexota bacterium]
MTTQYLRPIVLDTSVVSVLLNERPAVACRYYEDQLRGSRLLVSFQTLEEIWFGAYQASWGLRRRGELTGRLARYEVVWPGPELVDRTAQLRVEQRRKGRELTTADAWIAATALSLGCPLAAHDRDFGAVDGLALIQAPAA